MSKRRPAPSQRRAPPVSKRPAAAQARQVTARIAGDRRAAELLQLEMRRLARRLGLKVDSVRIRRVTPTT